MTIEFPCLLSSQKAFHWTLQRRLSCDYFGFQEEGAGALLLIGMHLSDPMPWLCARHPLYFPGPPGIIDLESKRILGKRFQMNPAYSPESCETLDPMALVLDVMERAGHSLAKEAEHPILDKVPGKLLPRKLTATARIVYQGQEFTVHSRNFSELSQCLHAELTLLFGLSRILSQMPDQAAKLDSFQLETTLKPCKMCAAFLHILRRKCVQFQVSYREDDPGRLAANTLLDQAGYRSNP
jgi:tRNA(Arg) A34 adenosine deaminase TadA